MDTEFAAMSLEALGQPTRLDVFRLLVKAGEPGLPFGEIQALTGVPGIDAVSSSGDVGTGRSGDPDQAGAV